MLWSAFQIEEIRGQVAKGLSRAAIAEIYGVTRNAVVGLCYRKGITGKTNSLIGTLIAAERRKRARLLKNGGQPSRDLRIRKKNPAFEFKFEAPQDEPAPLRVSLLDLTDGECHWLCDETTYCGHLAVHKGWCSHHYHRVYRVRR